MQCILFICQDMKVKFICIWGNQRIFVIKLMMPYFYLNDPEGKRSTYCRIQGHHFPLFLVLSTSYLSTWNGHLKSIIWTFWAELLCLYFSLSLSSLSVCLSFCVSTLSVSLSAFLSALCLDLSFLCLSLLLPVTVSSHILNSSYLLKLMQILSVHCNLLQSSMVLVVWTHYE